MGDDNFDPEHPWRTSGATGAPLSGKTPKKYSEDEISENVSRKPAAAKTASETAGEPKQSDYTTTTEYNLAMKRWAARQTGVSAGRGYASKPVSAKK